MEKQIRLIRFGDEFYPEVFWATYGTTTANDIDTAVAAGKAVMCRYNNKDYVLSYYASDGTYIYFGCCYTTTVYYLSVKRSNDNWGNSSKSIQDSSKLVSSWSDTTSDSKYPSEKLVKDTIDSTVGDIQTLLAAI